MPSSAQAIFPSVVLSPYPLTRDFEASVREQIGGEATFTTIAALRQMGLWAMVLRLRSTRADRVFLAVESSEAAALLPVLELLGYLIQSRAIYRLDGNLDLVRVGFGRVLFSIVNLFGASIDGWRKMRQAAKQVTALLREERHDIRFPNVTGEQTDLVFLNANLWFGLKAGGSVGHISGVVNGFLDSSLGVTFVSAGGRLLVRDAAPLVELVPPRCFGFPWEFNNYRFNFDVIEQTRSIVKAVSAGFIYQRLSLCNFAGVALSRHFQIPLVIEYNGSEAWIAKNWGQTLRSQRIAEEIEKVNIAHAHLIVTISDVLRDELIERGVEEDRIVTYPNCIDPVAFDPNRFNEIDVKQLRQSHGIHEDAIIVTFVGTFGQWHGASVLADAARSLLDREPSLFSKWRLHFLFVGDGVKMPDVQAALGPHVDGPHVTFAGLVPQERAPLYLAASDILASPHVPNSDGTRFFGSPTKLFEYMAMGKAIIASDLDQIGEVLSGSVRVDSMNETLGHPPVGAVALLTAPGSAKEIAEGIRFLVKHSLWRRELGENARQRALARYTWRDHVGAILQRVQSLS